MRNKSESATIHRRNGLNKARSAVLFYASKCCEKCGSKESPTVDHVTPRSMGGFSFIWNYQRLCKPCNQAKDSRLEDFRGDEWTGNIFAAIQIVPMAPNYRAKLIGEIFDVQVGALFDCNRIEFYD